MIGFMLQMNASALCVVDLVSLIKNRWFLPSMRDKQNGLRI